MKKLIPCALILAMLLTLLPISAFAAESVTWAGVTIHGVVQAESADPGPLGMFVVTDENGNPLGVTDRSGYFITGDTTFSVAPGARTHVCFESYQVPDYSPDDENAMTYAGAAVWTPDPTDTSVTQADLAPYTGEYNMLAICDGSNAEDPSQEEWIFLMLTGTPSAPQTVGSFQDVHQGDYCAEPVAWALEKGITTGTTDTTFSPAATCTTAQILTFLWRAQGSPEPKGSGAFSDVAAGDYFAKAAQWAGEQGLVDGETFGGGTPCTRSATVTYLWKLAGSPAASGAAFGDVAADAEYAQAVAWAVEQGITTGTTDTTFSPAATCTRGQIVTFLYRDFAE